MHAHSAKQDAIHAIERLPDDVPCVFRSMPATSSGACRARIPVHAGPPFRLMPAGGCDAG
jgi:hypothetical protein